MPLLRSVTGKIKLPDKQFKSGKRLRNLFDLRNGAFKRESIQPQIFYWGGHAL